MSYTCLTGCQWRNLPINFSPWPAVYYYFRRWEISELWQRLNEAVNQADRHLVRLDLRHQVGSRPPKMRGFVPVAKR